MDDLVSLITEGISRGSHTAPVLTTSHLMTYKDLTGHPVWILPPCGPSFTAVWAMLPKHNLTTPIRCPPLATSNPQSSPWDLGSTSPFCGLFSRYIPAFPLQTPFRAILLEPPLLFLNTLSYLLLPVIQYHSENLRLCNKSRKHIDIMMEKKRKKGNNLKMICFSKKKNEKPLEHQQEKKNWDP